MKKYLFIAAIALVSSAACSKFDTDAPNQTIAFEVGAFSAVESRANTALEDENIGNHFYTTAKLFANGVANAQDFMTDVEVLYTASPKTWAPARDYYWPKNAASYINFYSYVSSAAALNPTISFNAAKNVATATYTDKTIAATDNILLADAALKQNGNRTDYVDVSGVTSGVPTLFRHLLAKINFTVKLQTAAAKKSADTRFVVTILNADTNLSNLVVESKGSYTVENDFGSTAAPTTKPWTAVGGAAAPTVWTPAATSVPETISFLTPALTLAANTTECTAVSLLDERTIMPQALTTVQDLNLSFKIETFYGSEATPYMTEIFNVTGDIKDLVNTISAWNKNTKITYNIIIDPVSEKITFDPAVEEWATEEATYNWPE